MAPTTRYVLSGGVSIAYQVFGKGPIDLVYVPSFVSHVELQWADPAFAHYLERLASSMRVIEFDMRGTGMSERVSEPPPLEQRVEDMRAVLDAVGCRRAAILGCDEGVTTAALFAAMYPERCAALITHSACFCAPLLGEHGRDLLTATDSWGEGRTLDVTAPSLVGSSFIRHNWALFERAAATADMARSLAEMVSHTDLSEVLRTIRSPTLVLHRRDDPVPIAQGRLAAELIPGAKFVELDGSDCAPYLGDANAVLAEIEAFLAQLTGSTARAGHYHATVLFTDIVGSTERIVQIGEDRWRDILETHDALSRAEIDTHGGHVVKSLGDGFLATFDGPVRAVRCAWAIREQMRRVGLQIRAGVHAGECELVGDDVRGLAVHVAARVTRAASPGEVLISKPTRELLVGSGIALDPRRGAQLKGLPGEWELYALAADPPFAEAVPKPTDERSSAPARLSSLDRLQVRVARLWPSAMRRALRLLSRPVEKSPPRAR